MIDPFSPTMIRLCKLEATAVGIVDAMVRGRPGLAAEYLRTLQRDARSLEVELGALSTAPPLETVAS